MKIWGEKAVVQLRRGHLRVLDPRQLLKIAASLEGQLLELKKAT
jgi:hypothetical protein